MNSISKSTLDAACASRMRTAAAAGLLTVLLACGPGFAQNPPTDQGIPGTPLLRRGTIHEEDLSIPGTPPAPAVPEAPAPAVAEPAPATESVTGGASPPPGQTQSPGFEVDRAVFQAPDGSYELPALASVAGANLPQRRASMKLVQQGRALLKAQKHKAALGRFEQAIGIDAANPYGHYFIARAHYFLENYRESLSFLDVAELNLAADPRWLAEVHVLRARNAAAIGFKGQADVSYVRALGLNPDHAFALAQLTTIDTGADIRRNP